MKKPRLLDIFCGGGGAAVGYHRAGFEVVGVDIKPQPHYPFTFIQMDALLAMDLLLGGKRIYDTQGNWWSLSSFNAYHASPPCQYYSRMRHLPWLRDKIYPALIGDTRNILAATGKPWVIENVMDAHLPGGWLCGTMFGLPFYRHRVFETSFFWLQPGHPKHTFVIKPGRYFGDAGDRANKREAVCWDWMSKMEQRQAIPPAYCEHIGRFLMKVVEEAKVKA